MVKRRRPKPLLYLIILMFLVSIALIAIGGLWQYFESPVDKNNDTSIEFIIPEGTSTNKIGELLKEKGLIKNELFFKVYMKLESTKSLKAATYDLNKSMSLKEIVNILEEGSKVDHDAISMTFKEGQRVTDYIKVIANKLNYTEEEVKLVINDQNYVAGLIDKYWFLSNKIMNKDIYYALEGYLAPDTYFFSKDVDVQGVVEKLLDEQEKKLEKYKTVLENKDVHDVLTLASMAELEGKKLEDRKNIVGVFNNRLKAGISLGSDVTTYYAFQVPMTEQLTLEQYNTINPYNTRPTSKAGLPVGPICNPSIDSIEAAINPIDNEYFYFVANNKGVVFFSKTAQDQNKVIADLKSKGEWQ